MLHLRQQTIILTLKVPKYQTQIFQSFQFLFNYKFIQIMNKDEIIKNICQQNQELKQQVNYWKNQYKKLQKQYQYLLASTKQANNSSSPQKIQKSIALQEVNLFDSDVSSANTTSPSQNTQIVSSLVKKPQSPQKQATALKETQKRQDLFDFFSQKIKEAPALDKNICELIQGCFIIEKNSSIDHFDPVKFAYPQNKYLKLRSMFDIIYRFVFVNDRIVEINDDEFDSRKNQILFGTPYQDFQFVFDNISQNKGEKGRLNQFQKSTYILRKRYVYGIVRPQIVKIDKILYETQIAYGFLSHLPFPNFFKDLNRIVQQEIKYRMLNMGKIEVKLAQKVDIIAEIIKEITSKSLQKKLHVTSYPINLELKANICGLRLVYSTKNNYISDQFNHIQSFINKFSLLKLIKILHYVLAEQSIIIICNNRKRLNQMFQIIRSIIYPFNWIFPIVYYYSPFFEPFLTSPLPILIGFVKKSEAEEGFDLNRYANQNFPENQLVHIYADDQKALDKNEVSDYRQSIDQCYNSLNRQKNSPKKEKSMSSLLEKSGQERTTNKIFKYVKKLRSFIQTGKIDQEINPFLIQFMESQMVSYFKQSQAQQKHSKS